MKRLLTLLAATAALAAAVFAGNAGAATTDLSSNWSGYSVSGAAFSNVSGSWVEPKATCTGSTTSSAFWVGLGGDSDTSNALEQIGTSTDCSATGKASYTAWYELVPAASVPLRLTIAPGDKIWASVGVDGTKVTLTVENLTRQTSFTKTLSMTAPDVSSAEWIAEAPSTCDNAGRCRTVPLTDFHKITFTKALATAGGHTGTISDPAWTADAIQLDSADDYGPFATMSTAAEADPTALSRGGSEFSVSYSGLSQPSQTDPYGGPGFGVPGFDL